MNNRQAQNIFRASQHQKPSSLRKNNKPQQGASKQGVSISEPTTSHSVSNSIYKKNKSGTSVNTIKEGSKISSRVSLRPIQEERRSSSERLLALQRKEREKLIEEFKRGPPGGYGSPLTGSKSLENLMPHTSAQLRPAKAVGLIAHSSESVLLRIGESAYKQLLPSTNTIIGKLGKVTVGRSFAESPETSVKRKESYDRSHMSPDFSPNSFPRSKQRKASSDSALVVKISPTALETGLDVSKYKSNTPQALRVLGTDFKNLGKSSWRDTKHYSKKAYHKTRDWWRGYKESPRRQTSNAKLHVALSKTNQSFHDFGRAVKVRWKKGFKKNGSPLLSKKGPSTSRKTLGDDDTDEAYERMANMVLGYCLSGVRESIQDVVMELGTMSNSVFPGHTIQLVSMASGKLLHLVGSPRGGLTIDALGEFQPSMWNANFMVEDAGRGLVRLHNHFNYIHLNKDGEVSVGKPDAKNSLAPETRIEVREQGWMASFHLASATKFYLSALPIGMCFVHESPSVDMTGHFGVKVVAP